MLLPQIKALQCQPLFPKYSGTSGVSLFVCIELTWLALVEFLNHPFIWSWIITSSSPPSSPACVLSNQSLPVSYSKRCVHAVFGVLVGMLYILFVSITILKVVPLACREEALQHTPRTTWKDPVVSSCSSDFYLPAFPPDRLLFFDIFSIKHVFSPTKSLSVTKSQSLPFIHHLVQILVHVVNRAFHFRTCLSFLEAGSMSRNCFRGLGVVREKCP